MPIGKERLAGHFYDPPRSDYEQVIDKVGANLKSERSFLFANVSMFRVILQSSYGNLSVFKHRGNQFRSR